MSELDNTNLNSNPQENQDQNDIGTDSTSISTDNNEKTTFTRDEVMALIQKESDKRVTQALATQERKNQAKLKEAQKLASMSAEEKFRYELDQREAAIAEKEHQLLLAENRAEASKVLADKGLSQTFLDFVVAETAEEMNDKINLINRAFKESVRQEVERRLGSNAPKAPSTPSGQITKEQFKNLSLAQKQEIYRTDRELYNSLTN